MIELTGQSRQQGKEIRWKDCPACHRDYWVVSQNGETGAWTCYGCGAKGSQDLGISANVLLDRLKVRDVCAREWHEVDLPEWVPLTRTARKYLRDRGILRPEDFGIVELAEGKRVLIPYFGDQGQPIWWVTRAFMDDGRPKYVGAPGRKPPLVLPRWEKHDEVVFVEGPIDAIVHWLATGVPTIALGGKTIPSYLRSTINSVAGPGRTLMLDKDALGAKLVLGQELEAEVVTLPDGLDPADYFKEEANGKQR